MSDENHAATLAADWWAARLRERPECDRYTLQEWERITPDQLEDFRRRLVASVTASLDSLAEVWLRVDYYAEGVLGEVAASAGLPSWPYPVFPSKIVMRVTSALVRVRDGYGTPWTALLGTLPEEDVIP